MHRAVHVFLILAILPGVILPGQTTLCLGAAIACGGCSVQRCGSEAAGAELRPCCRKHTPAKLTLSAKRACHCCVVLTPHKQTTPKPASRSGDAMPVASLPPVVPTIAILTAIPSRESMPRATSHAPPGAARLFPLLI
jgi:hypothetical protein